MEEEYDWELILKVAVPLALAEGYIFYAAFRSGWRWFLLVIGLLLAGYLVYRKNKKKSNVFTAVGIVFLAALIIRFLKNFGVL